MERKRGVRGGQAERKMTEDEGRWTWGLVKYSCDSVTIGQDEALPRKRGERRGQRRRGDKQEMRGVKGGRGKG